MYTLYYIPGACSLATQTVLHELEQDVNIVDIKDVDDFSTINPVSTVPVLVDGDRVLREGAAVMLYLLDKHESAMLPREGRERTRAIQNIMFANATMHPAYSRLFFIDQAVSDSAAKMEAYQAAAKSINNLWDVVNRELGDKPFLGGDRPSAADIMLTVYSRWGEYFPVKIDFGSAVEAMLDEVQKLPSFRKALDNESRVSSA